MSDLLCIKWNTDILYKIFEFIPYEDWTNTTLTCVEWHISSKVVFDRRYKKADFIAFGVMAYMFSEQLLYETLRDYTYLFVVNMSLDSIYTEDDYPYLFPLQQRFYQAKGVHIQFSTFKGAITRQTNRIIQVIKSDPIRYVNSNLYINQMTHFKLEGQIYQMLRIDMIDIKRKI